MINSHMVFPYVLVNHVSWVAWQVRIRKTLSSVSTARHSTLCVCVCVPHPPRRECVGSIQRLGVAVLGAEIMPVAYSHRGDHRDKSIL